ncbi:hypothetical protein NCC49_001175 [Naganishia albida]|nr:hypothetical protein NCC49_001175 [Naganishia albida]
MLSLLRQRAPPLPLTRRISHAIQPAPQKIDISALDTPKVFVSSSHNPWFNLSYEEWLFRNTPVTTPILFFYRNAPCVVIGRNQNPWKETTPALLHHDGIPLIRRRSGGGAVFHDLGNMNFSFLLPRALFTRSLGADIIVHALHGMGFPQAQVNDRGDLVLLADGVPKKMSPHPYKIVSQRAYHHGTMLVSSDLKNLGRYLRSKTPQISTRGIDSVRSPVTNLTSASSTTHESFIRSVARSFLHTFHTGDLSGAFGKDAPVDVEQVEQGAVLDAGDDRAVKIRAGMEEMKTWDWTYGQTPEFNIILESTLSFGDIKMDIASKHGLITSCTTTASVTDSQLRTDLKKLDDRLVEQRYDAIEVDAERVEMREVVDWLRASV